MHYFIDGYNLAFRINRFCCIDFQKARQSWIDWLNHHAISLRLHITVVYDASYCPGIEQKTHYGHLEIYYTTYGQSADEWILHQLERHQKNSHFTVVTSDKRLANQARNFGAKTESVENFVQQVESRLEKKTNIKKEVFTKKLKSPETPLSKAPLKPTAEIKKEVVVGEFEYYLQAFEKKMAELDAEILHAHTSSKLVKRKKNSLKQVKDNEDDQKRWQRFFEQRYRELIDKGDGA